LTTPRIDYEKVLIKDNITIDSPIRVSDYTDLEIQARINLAVGSNCDIIQNRDMNTGNWEVRIHGGILYGDDTGSAGNGIHWQCPTQGPEYRVRVWIYEMEIWDVEENGLLLNASSGNCQFRVSNVAITGPDLYGIRMRVVSDSFFSNLAIVSSGSNIYAEYGSNNHFEHIYCGGSGSPNVYLKAIYRSIFMNIRSDNPDTHAIELHGCEHNVFNGGQIRSSGTNDTYDGFYLHELVASSNCTHNIISNYYIGRGSYAGVENKYRYGINEGPNCDYNTYSVINAYDTWSGFNISGSNSHISASWNVTSWIDNYP